MSSSSSIAAARRRRAGGAGGPTPPTPSQNGASSHASSPQAPSTPVNPLVLLQQHHIKINVMEKMIHEISLKQSALNVSSTNSSGSIAPQSQSQSQSQSKLQTPNPDLNINELSDLIMNKVEGQLDLKAFYDNDERLMNEIEELKTIIQSQQMVINGLNTTLYTIIDKLNISPLQDKPSVDEMTREFVDAETSDDMIGTFPKSVIINEANNTIKEFIADSMEKNLEVTEYDSKSSITFEGSLQA